MDTMAASSDLAEQTIDPFLPSCDRRKRELRTDDQYVHSISAWSEASGVIVRNRLGDKIPSNTWQHMPAGLESFQGNKAKKVSHAQVVPPQGNPPCCTEDTRTLDEGAWRPDSEALWTLRAA